MTYLEDIYMFRLKLLQRLHLPYSELPQYSVMEETPKEEDWGVSIEVIERLANPVHIETTLPYSRSQDNCLPSYALDDTHRRRYWQHSDGVADVR